METKRISKSLLLAAKAAVGSGAAIYIAGLMHLEYASSAGIITLLSLLATKWETLKLSLFRLASFFITAALAWLCFPHLESKWIAFGIIIFVMTFLADFLGLRATLSVNAVAVTHFMMDQSLTVYALNNELMLVLLGVAIALLLNLFHFNRNRKKDIIEGMRYVEENLQAILCGMADYLLKQESDKDVRKDIRLLERRLREYGKEAVEYQDNTFQTHTRYYGGYFEMRMNQCHILDSLHRKIARIGSVPEQAKMVADYMYYLAPYVVERNLPDIQIDRLHQVFEEMKEEEMPETREEFESRALLYHILMDIEEFLKFKYEFVKNLDDIQRAEYWK